MLTVLGIDQSLTSTGIVVLEAFNENHVEVAHYQQVKSSRMCEDWVTDTLSRSAAIAREILVVIEQYQPDYVVFESPSLCSKGSATRTLSMLLGILLDRLPSGIGMLHVPPSTLKKFATGTGNAGKDLMVEAVSSVNRGLYETLVELPKSHGRYDIADACHLANYKLQELIHAN